MEQNNGNIPKNLFEKYGHKTYNLTIDEEDAYFSRSDISDDEEEYYDNYFKPKYLFEKYGHNTYNFTIAEEEAYFSRPDISCEEEDFYYTYHIEWSKPLDPCPPGISINTPIEFSEWLKEQKREQTGDDTRPPEFITFLRAQREKQKPPNNKETTK